MNKWILISVLCCLHFCVNAQNSFVDYQKTFGRVSIAFNQKEDTLRKAFAAKKMEWPAKYVYLRSFKYDSELEVWVKSKAEEEYRLFKSYRICALAGTLGPKRIEGDYQVPEGFYYINDFNPNSAYHLSLGLNYPNPSDNVLSDALEPGGDIYIHGSCVTEGCIPITNPQIEELYIITAHARSTGLDFIPVHIFPIRFGTPKSEAFLEQVMRDNAELQAFEKTMKQAFDYFNVTHQLPVVSVNAKGEYVLF